MKYSNLSGNWIKAAYVFLIIAMILGTFLRMSFFYRPFDFNYKFVLHGHSHVILLGWVFNALCGLLIHQFPVLNTKLNKLIFWLFQVTVVGMLFTFPIQGYAFWSIIFSTAHILLTFGFVIHCWRRTKQDHSITMRMIRMGMIYLCLSTIGPFALGPLVAAGYSGTPIYDLAIYFYLHFLYNGFFVMMLIAILLQHLQEHGIQYSAIQSSRIYFLIGFSVLPGFVLSALGFFPMKALYGLGLSTAFLQLSGTYYWLKITLNKKAIDLFARVKWLYLASIFSLAMKFLLQVASAMPQFRTEIFENHGFIIAYLHLVFVGFITFLLLAILLNNSTASFNKGWIWAVNAFLLLGFVGSEVAIAFPAWIMLISWNPFVLTFVLSLLILIGVILLAPKLMKINTGQ